MDKKRTTKKRPVVARKVKPVVLHPKLNDCFVATAKDGKQIAVQVHDCRNGEVYYMVWRDGQGMVGYPNRCTLPLWRSQLADSSVDSSKKAWKAFYDKQKGAGESPAPTGAGSTLPEIKESADMAETYPESEVLNWGEISFDALLDWVTQQKTTGEQDVFLLDVESVKGCFERWWKRSNTGRQVRRESEQENS